MTAESKSSDEKLGVDRKHLELLGSMATGVAHDFNNILVGIIGNARLLLEQDYVTPEGKQLVEEILDCAKRASDLSGEMLVYSEAVHREEEVRVESDPEKTGDENTEVRYIQQERKMSVLVIDDEKVVRSVTRAVLERAGYNVITAGGGKEGLDIFEKLKSQIDAVLLDLSMPYMSGSLVFARLKAMKNDIKVFLMSGYTGRQVLQQFEGEGVCGFIQKPFQPEDLLEVLSRELKSKKKVNLALVNG